MTNYIQHFRYLKNALQYGSLSKILNFARIIVSYLLSLIKLEAHFTTKPYFISIEPTDYCQLECPECPVGINKRKSGHKIDFDVFKSIINDISKDIFHVIFYFQGEPLLHKNLAEMIKYTHNAGIFTSTSTNAQLLNNNNAKEIVLSGLDKIIISMDGVTQDVYASYRVGGQLDLVLKGIEYINFWKKELHSVTPFVEVQFVVFKTNEHQLSEMRLFAKRLGVFRLSFKTAQLYNYEFGHPLLTTIPRYARYKQMPDGRYVVKNSLPNRCFRAWSGAVVSSRGEVLPCCFDKDASHSYGCVIDTSFEAVYTGAKAQAFKHSLLNNRSQYVMCRNCTSR